MNKVSNTLRFQIKFNFTQICCKIDSGDLVSLYTPVIRVSSPPRVTCLSPLRTLPFGPRKSKLSYETEPVHDKIRSENTTIP